MEFEPFPPCLLPEEAELELFPSLLPPSREELGGAEVPAFDGLVWEGLFGLAWALVLVLEAECEPEAFLDWGPLVDRASLLGLAGA